MSEEEVIDPLALSFEVRCGVDHAFRTWVERIDSWWPRGHTISGDPGARVVLEPGVGGRIYERTPDGREVDWGEITAWEPPGRLGYRWHIRRMPSEATDVDIRFVALDGSRTRLDITQTGWERLGAEARTWRDANTAGWRGLLPHFEAAAVAP